MTVPTSPRMWQVYASVTAHQNSRDLKLVELMSVNNFLQVVLPDMEFFVNLGDWPLVKHNTKPIPILSWCGSADTLDIVMPTYDLTESTLETMGRYKPQSVPRFFSFVFFHLH